MPVFQFEQNSVQPIVPFKLLDQYGKAVTGISGSAIEVYLHKSQTLAGMVPLTFNVDFEWGEVQPEYFKAEGLYILRELATANVKLTDIIGTCIIDVALSTGAIGGRSTVYYQVVSASGGGGLGLDTELGEGAGGFNTVGEVLIAMRSHAKGTRHGINDSEVGLAADRLTEVINRRAEPAGGPYTTFREAGDWISKDSGAVVVTDATIMHGDRIIWNTADVGTDGGNWSPIEQFGSGVVTSDPGNWPAFWG